MTAVVCFVLIVLFWPVIAMVGMVLLAPVAWLINVILGDDGK